MKQEFHEIYEKYGSELYAFILRMCRSEQLAISMRLCYT